MCYGTDLKLDGILYCNYIVTILFGKNASKGFYPFKINYNLSMKIQLDGVTVQEGIEEEIISYIDSVDITDAFPDGYEAEIATELDVNFVEITPSTDDTYHVCLYAQNVTVGTQSESGSIITMTDGTKLDIYVKPD